MLTMAAAGWRYKHVLLALAAVCLPVLLMLTARPFSQLAEFRCQNYELRQMPFDYNE